MRNTLLTFNINKAPGLDKIPALPIKKCANHERATIPKMPFRLRDIKYQVKRVRNTILTLSAKQSISDRLDSCSEHQRMCK